jgi:membrane dipeptidase
MNRRHFVLAAAAMPLSAAWGRALAAVAAGPPGTGPALIGDMHFHLFFFGPKPAATQPLARNMAAGGATLVSWSLVGDVPWLTPVGGGFKQKGTPQPGEAVSWFKREMGRVHGHISEQGLTVARTEEDVERALTGVPHVVLSVEGATFLDDGLEQLQVAYDLGIRHVQLVHFIRNQIGDFQTEPAQHQGLTAFGRRVILECNRLGILVDLAHCSDAAVQQALAVTKVPMVWSHSSVQRGSNTLSAANTVRAGWQIRQLSRATAKAIADHGGVVGLWGLSADTGSTIEGYADRLLELADWLGDTHVAFGSDMNGLSKPVLANFSDHRRVVTLLEKRNIGREKIENIAIRNYATALRTAMRARTA